MPIPQDENWFQQVLETAPDAMIIVGEDGKIRFVNLQTERLFGYSRAELIGQKLETLIPERLRHSHAGHVARFFNHPGTRPMGSGIELFGRRVDGAEISIEVSLSPVHSGGAMLVSAAIRDITERKRTEALARLAADRLARLSLELAAAKATAEAASEAKSEFLSSMSHELRTPLNAILGFAQLLRRDRKEPLSGRHSERVSQILKGGEHLLRLIDDILDLSRIEAGAVSLSTEPVSVDEVLQEVGATLEPMASRSGLELIVPAASTSSPMVLADRTRFAQTLMNFGSNAIKYNRPSGSVRFSVSHPEPQFVRVTVADTGLGIPLEKQSKLFQPFQRAGQETGSIEGTGIGLVITKRLAELMSGRVGFESVAGEGSKFWVDLPLHAAERAKARASLRASREPHLSIAGKQLALYVEDNPANVLFMKDLLEGFEAIEFIVAPTAEIGVELARAKKPAVVIMDINLPGMSGVDALRVLQADPECCAIPVIALTAAASERDRQRGVEAGFYRYLTKPIQVDEFEVALESVLGAPPTA